MSLLQKKRWWQQIARSYITLTILFLICAGLVVSVYDRYVIEREMAKRRTEKESELKELQERRSGLKKQVEYLSRDEGVEAEIRRHFDVAKEGEQVVVLVENERDDSVSATAHEEERPSFWLRFWPW